MRINAIIESKGGGTLVLDFPRSIYDVYEKLQSVGIRQSPHQITLSDEEGDDVRVKLYSEDEIGKHLLLTLKEQNSLADANNQKKVYTEMIAANKHWEFAGLYADI